MAKKLEDQRVADLAEALLSNAMPEAPDYNICPTQDVGVVTSEEGVRRYRPMRWGFVPHWYKAPADGPLLINARAETIAKKPAFAQACRARRCLVPISGFYEWTKDEAGNRLPWYSSLVDEEPLFLAGVWQGWQQGDDMLTSFAIVTCPAGPDLRHIHHREPVSLRAEDWGKWLGEEGHGAALLMRAAEAGAYQSWRVDSAVNSNRAAGPDLTCPL